LIADLRVVFISLPPGFFPSVTLLQLADALQITPALMCCPHPGQSITNVG